jgi:hypothetical protein
MNEHHKISFMNCNGLKFSMIIYEIFYFIYKGHPDFIHEILSMNILDKLISSMSIS